VIASEVSKRESDKRIGVWRQRQAESDQELHDRVVVPWTFSFTELTVLSSMNEVSHSCVSDR
jgi:hypothetical protein